MSSLSVMEWNAKPPLQWEWESVAASLPSKGTENPKIWPSIDWGTDVDEQIASGSLISYQGDCGSGVSSGGTSFDLRYASKSKTSKSTSMTSSSTEDKKMFNLSVEASGKVPSEDFISQKDEFSGTSPTLESSVCSGEPFLSLKLGKRAYFEDISDKPTSAFPLIGKSTDISAKRIRSTAQNTSAACCQVEGCKLDLSSSKDYHRKHKVCANHSKSQKVIVNGVERRFCQQCSRFHGLAEFDENKRSCRKRLSDHNARRRRPHPNVDHFKPSNLSTIIYGGLQQVTPVFSRIPSEQNSKSSSSIMWSNTSSSINFKAAAGKHEATHHGNMLLPGSMRTVTELSDDGSYGLLPLNGVTVKIHGGGGSAEETNLISSNTDMQPPQDLHRALSLLSTDARDSSQPRSVPVSALGPHLQVSNIASGVVKPWTYRVLQSSPPPLASSAPPHQLWHAEEQQWSNNSQRLSVNHEPLNTGNSHNFNNGNAFPECLLSEGQHEFGFDLMHLN